VPPLWFFIVRYIRHLHDFKKMEVHGDYHDDDDFGSLPVKVTHISARITI
jgi:hypothetical protein